MPLLRTSQFLRRSPSFLLGCHKWNTKQGNIIGKNCKVKRASQGPSLPSCLWAGRGHSAKSKLRRSYSLDEGKPRVSVQDVNALPEDWPGCSGTIWLSWVPAVGWSARALSPAELGCLPLSGHPSHLRPPCSRCCPWGDRIHIRGPWLWRSWLVT